MNSELEKVEQISDINLNTLLKHNIDNYLSSNEFKENIDSTVKNLINKLTQESLREYGPIGKKIKEHIEKACMIDNYDLPPISIIDIVLQEVNQSLSSIIHEETLNKLNERVKENLQLPIDKDKNIDFKDILILILRDSKSINHNCEDYDINDFFDYNDIRDFITCIIEDRKDEKYYDIYLDDEPDKTEKQCSYHIGVNKKTGSIIYYHSVSYKGINDVPVNQYRLVNSFYGIPSTLYKLEVVGAKINIESIENFK